MERMRKKTAPRMLPASIVVVCVTLALSILYMAGLFDGESSPGDILPIDRPGSTGAGPVVDGEIDDPVSIPSSNGNGGEEPIRENSQPRSFNGIRACVRDADTEEPLSRFTAWATREDLSAEERAEERTDVKRPGKPFMNTAGMLTLYGLEEGRYTLLLRSQGFQDLTVTGLQVPQKKGLIEISMSKGIHITGRVVDTAGVPVEGMLVHINCEPFNSSDPPPDRKSAVTDGKGRFLFGDLVVGKYDLFLHSRRAPLDSATAIYLADGGSFEKEFVIPTFTTFRFHVTTVRDQPLVNVAIKVRTETKTYRAKTDQKGRAAIERIPPGSYDIELSKSRYETWIEKVNVTSISGERSFDIRLESQL